MNRYESARDVIHVAAAAWSSVVSRLWLRDLGPEVSEAADGVVAAIASLQNAIFHAEIDAVKVKIDAEVAAKRAAEPTPAPPTDKFSVSRGSMALPATLVDDQYQVDLVLHDTTAVAWDDAEMVCEECCNGVDEDGETCAACNGTGVE